MWSTPFVGFGLWGDHPTIPLTQRVWCKVGHRSEMFVTIWLVGERMATHWSWGPLLVTSAMADVFRYQYYALSSCGLHLRWLTWLRYSMFIIQWPLNALAEAAFIATAFPLLLTYAAFGGSPIFSYAWVALAFQVRNVNKLSCGGFDELRVARQRRLQVAPERVRKSS